MSRKLKNVGFLFDVVKFFSTQLHFSVVNLTTDNRFSSSQLSAELLHKHITVLEMMRKSTDNFTVNLKQERQERLG